MADKPGRSEEAHDKPKGEGLGKPESPPGQSEPEAEPKTVTSSDVGEQTHTKASLAEAESEG